MNTNNEVLRPVPYDHDGGRLLVREIFYTLQGEGPFAGRPAIFVRLGGCNLACWFCDTDYSSVNSTPLSVESVVDVAHAMRQKKAGCSLVVITGGEPLRQARVLDLITSLRAMHFEVQVETAGTLMPEGAENVLGGPGVTVVVSPKTPSLHPRLSIVRPVYKYLVDEHGLVRDTQGKTSDVPRPAMYAGASVYVQPLDTGDEHANARAVQAATKMALENGWRLSLQQHKIAGVP